MGSYPNLSKQFCYDVSFPAAQHWSQINACHFSSLSTHAVVYPHTEWLCGIYVSIEGNELGTRMTNNWCPNICLTSSEPTPCVSKIHWHHYLEKIYALFPEQQPSKVCSPLGSLPDSTCCVCTAVYVSTFRGWSNGALKHLHFPFPHFKV